MSDEAGPAPKPASAAALAEADAKFERGIQCIRANDIETAVQLFAEVLELRTHHYGELALECAPAYYRYGAALLYQAQDNDDVFGASMKEAGEGEGEEAEEEEPAGDKENSRDKGKIPAAPDAEEDEEEGGEEGEGGENDLQLAWENLESAKVIWGRQGEGQHSEQLADVHSLLGDVAMESDDFPTALAELDAALDHLLAFVQPDDRRIAEVQYKRCCALQFAGDAEAALPAVQAACDCLVLRQQALASKLTAVGEGPAAEKLTAEQADVAALLQDLKEKVQELEAMAAENADTKAMIKNTFAQFAAGNNAGAQAKPAGDGGGGGTADVGGSGTATDSGVQNLGVVGRGTKRINLQAVQTNVPGALPGGGAGAPAGEPLPKKKRSLAELMGDDEGKTSIGFGQAPAPVAACEAAPAAAASCAEGSGVQQAVPSFLQAASVQAVYGEGAQAGPPPAQT